MSKFKCKIKNQKSKSKIKVKNQNQKSKSKIKNQKSKSKCKVKNQSIKDRRQRYGENGRRNKSDFANYTQRIFSEKAAAVAWLMKGGDSDTL